MAYLEEVLSEFRKGAKIRRKDWDEGKYIVCNGNFVDNDLGRVHSLTNLDIIGNVWEFYQEPIDWNYIIENKCLCWFWGDCEKYTKEYGFLGFLTYVQSGKNTDRFEDLEGKIWKHCRPVRRDEVIFYENRKNGKLDEQKNE